MRVLRLTESRRGSAAITYGLAVGLIAVVAIVAVQQVGGAISTLTNATAGKIDEVAGRTCPVTSFMCAAGRGGRPLTSEPVAESAVGEIETLNVGFRGGTLPVGEAECTDAGWVVTSGSCQQTR